MVLMGIIFSNESDQPFLLTPKIVKQTENGIYKER